MNTKNKIKTILSLAIVAMVIGPMAATSQALEVFSVNFWDQGASTPDKILPELQIEEDQYAGFDIWLTDGWENIEVPWNSPRNTLPPATITSTQGSTATFTLHDARNAGGSLSVSNLRTAPIGDGNGDLFDSCIRATEEGDDDVMDAYTKICDMTVSDIPFAKYYVIVYLSLSTSGGEDGSANIVFNGDAMHVYGQVSDGLTFTEIVNDGDTGNYIVYKGVTGDSFTFQAWGDGTIPFGPAGFQFGVYDPNTPSINVGPAMITVSELSVDMTATVVNNDTTQEPKRPLGFEWTAEPAAGVVFEPNEFVLEPTVTITDPAPNNPTTYKLTLSAGLVNPGGPPLESVGINKIKIDVYSDACKARIAAGDAPMYDLGDFNLDCITDLKDFADTSAAWLRDYTLQAPGEKP